MNNELYYESSRAIGKLFRSIDLPALREAERAGRRQRRRLQNATRDEELGDIFEAFYENILDEDDEVAEAVRERVAAFIVTEEPDDEMITVVWERFGSYVSALRSICADYTLSQSRSAMLTEAEAVVSERVWFANTATDVDAAGWYHRREMLAATQEEGPHVADEGADCEPRGQREGRNSRR